MKLKKIIMFFLLSTVFLISSCAHTVSENKNTLPRDSFIHLNKSFKIFQCDENGNSCNQAANLRSGASGFVVRVTSRGSYIITAAHFCEDDRPTIPNVRIVPSLVSKRLDGKEYTSRILEYQRDIDVCLVFAEGLNSGVSAVKFSNSAPKPGDKIYNIAAPYSIVGANMAPILDGRYNGELDSQAFYTLPAAPGSSGSMIVNESGELVGMVHSVFVRFHVITLSTTYESLMNFINTNLHKYSNESTGTSAFDLRGRFNF